eukprot:3351555-Alexandrium_andersonii.AAC.1
MPGAYYWEYIGVRDPQALAARFCPLRPPLNVIAHGARRDPRRGRGLAPGAARATSDQQATQALAMIGL